MTMWIRGRFAMAFRRQRVKSIVKMSRNVELFKQQAAKRKTRRARDNATAHLDNPSSS
jgi:hypothetical protein